MATKARSKIYTHLWYAKEAEEAASFYASIFPDSRVDRVTALLSESPSGPPGSVKIVDFTLFGQRFQAMSAGPHHEFNDAASIVVECDDQAELDRYWNGLLAGGGRGRDLRALFPFIHGSRAIVSSRDRGARLGRPLRWALSNSFAFGGSNATLVFGRTN